MHLRLMIAALALALGAAPAGAQAFDPGPPGMVVGRSMAHMPIVPVIPPLAKGIPNADIFGDEVEERAYGRDFDNSYLKPKIPNIGRDKEMPIELRATEGRSDLNPVNSGALSRAGPLATGAGPYTRIGRGVRR